MNNMMVATTGAPLVVGMGTFTLLGVEMPTLSVMTALTIGVLVRLWVYRKGGKNQDIYSNLLISGLCLIFSVGAVIEYQLSFFWTMMVSGGINTAGELILVTAKDQIILMLKDGFSAIRNKINGGKTESQDEPVVDSRETKEKE